MVFSQPDIVRLILTVRDSSTELEGLRAKLDKLVHHRENQDQRLQSPCLHLFYFHQEPVQSYGYPQGSKWVLSNDDGTTTVVEGEKIVGESPIIPPGETFSYNSYHVTHLSASACGSFHGLDEFGEKIHVRLEPFRLDIPDLDHGEETHLS